MSKTNVLRKVTRGKKTASQAIPQSVAATPTSKPECNRASDIVESDRFWNSLNQRADELTKRDQADRLFDALCDHIDYDRAGEERIAESLYATWRVVTLVSAVLDERPSSGVHAGLVEMMARQMHDSALQLQAIHLFRRATGYAKIEAHEERRKASVAVQS